MAARKSSTLEVREYARQQGITLQSVYRRIWQKQVQARKRYGRWLISSGQVDQNLAATCCQKGHGNAQSQTDKKH